MDRGRKKTGNWNAKSFYPRPIERQRVHNTVWGLSVSKVETLLFECENLPGAKRRKITRANYSDTEVIVARRRIWCASKHKHNAAKKKLWTCEKNERHKWRQQVFLVTGLVEVFFCVCVMFLLPSHNPNADGGGKTFSIEHARSGCFGKKQPPIKSLSQKFHPRKRYTI